MSTSAATPVGGRPPTTATHPAANSHAHSSQEPLPMMTMTTLVTMQLEVIYTILRGAFMFVILAIIPLVATYTLLLPIVLVLYPLSRHRMQYCIDTIIAMWFRLAIAWLSINGTQYEFYTSNGLTAAALQQLKTQQLVQICNHPTTADWMYLWALQDELMSLKNLKIVLKDQLRKLAPLGWPLQLAVHLFLARNWQQDSIHLQHVIEYYVGSKSSVSKSYPLQLLVFPEGTDLHAPAIARSNKFADANHLPHHVYTLHPRTTGFIHTVQQLRQYNGIDSIVDITVGYPAKKSPKKLEELVFGKFPKQIVYYVNVYPISELPQDDTGLSKWCTDRWTEKEKRLKHLYEVAAKHNAANGSTSAPLMLDDVNKQTAAKRLPCTPNYALQYATVLLWTAFSILCCYTIYASFSVKIYIVVVSLLLTLGTLGGGMDRMIVHRELEQRKKHKKQH